MFTEKLSWTIDMTTKKLRTKKKKEVSLTVATTLKKVPSGFSQIHSFPIYDAYRFTLYATACTRAPRCAYFEFPALHAHPNVQCMMVHGGFKCCPMCRAIAHSVLLYKMLLLVDVMIRV